MSSLTGESRTWGHIMTRQANGMPGVEIKLRVTLLDSSVIWSVDQGFGLHPHIGSRP